MRAALALLAVACLFNCRIWAQERPQAGPFNASQMDMQAPPAQGVAVRAGRLFDPKGGAYLMNQVILIKGDRITEVGPAERVKIPAEIP